MTTFRRLGLCRLMEYLRSRTVFALRNPGRPVILSIPGFVSRMWLCRHLLTKPHYVDHTPIDTTAVLTFIEKSFGLDPLTKRDAAQPDISFFDYDGAPNMTPPTAPSQPTDGPCGINPLP